MFAKCSWSDIIRDKGIKRNIYMKKTKDKIDKSSKVKLLLVSLIVGVVLSAGGIVGWTYFNGIKKDDSLSDESMEKETARISKEVEEEWRVVSEADSYDGGAVKLEEELVSAESKKEQSDVYMKLSVLAAQHEDFQLSLEHALKADETYPTRHTAKNVARSAFGIGDEDMGIKYFQIAIERTGDPGNDPEKEYFIYEAKLSIAKKGKE